MYPLKFPNLMKYMVTIHRTRYLVKNVVDLLVAMKESHMNGTVNVL